MAALEAQGRARGNALAVALAANAGLRCTEQWPQRRLARCAASPGAGPDPAQFHLQSIQSIVTGPLVGEAHAWTKTLVCRPLACSEEVASVKRSMAVLAAAFASPLAVPAGLPLGQPAAGQAAAAAPLALPAGGLGGIGQLMAVSQLASSLALLQHPQLHLVPSSSADAQGRAPAAVPAFQPAPKLWPPAQPQQPQLQPQPAQQ